ncbi:DUF370 domain-containing protein [Desulfonema magnum]|uniref:Putative regulatory protein dnm_075750 n=1 Tax=Desulfonema magnum TaxID=45655 RepID=A0A975BUE2_9BACT|nr:DUF370 domain-containing protein [Desulfonema magnum]QTA91507.1 DUF370 [Desulfonema magnum]
MEQSLLNIGFGSTVVAERVIAIVLPNSAPMKRLKDEAKDEKRLVDATHGRRTRSIIVMDSNHIVLSAIQAETISQRYEMLKESKKSRREKSENESGEHEAADDKGNQNV